MNTTNRKSWIKPFEAVFYIFILVSAVLVFGTFRSTGFDRMSVNRLLLQIQVDTQAYRLAELESILCFSEKQRTEYQNRKAFALQGLNQNLEKLGSVLVTSEENRALNDFASNWKDVLKKSQDEPLPAEIDKERPSAVVFAEKHRGLYEKSRQSLERLIEVSNNAPESWSGLAEIFTRSNRLTLAFLYIFGMIVLFVLLFNLFDKIRRKKPQKKH